MSPAPIQKFVFQTPPPFFNPKFEVSACFIKVNENFLFLKSQPHKPDGAVWGIPGGKLESGETPQEALLREVFEETSLSLEEQKVKHLQTVFVRHPHMDFTYHMFEYVMETRPEVIISLEEHSAFEWATLQEVLKNYHLIRGEDECLFLAYGISL